jgi:aminocarboxymuconate-semialdehyde decarboxylase
MTIDIHSHFFPETWPDYTARFGEPHWPSINHAPDGAYADIMLGDKFFRKVNPVCWNVDLRLADLDAANIDLQIISPTPVMFAYERDPLHAIEVAQYINDAALEICSRANGRLRAFCQVPLQDIDLACKEVSRAVRAGHLGVEIGNHVGLRNLDDEGIFTFLQHCAAENTAVFVHPWDMFGADRMPKSMMPWTVAMPAETQLAIVSIVLGGGFDRLPKSLRICFAHGGGSFAFLLARLENAWKHQPLARGESKHPPSFYLDRFYVDSAVFDHRSLAFLVDVMGEDRVCLGSDYPYPLGEENIGSLIRTSPLSASVKQKLLYENALRYLALPN